MPWVVGIDEAGYGPNLGPLVQAAAILWMPPEDLSGWKTYSDSVRRCEDSVDDRFLIDDSKKVHSGSRKLQRLERTVLPLKNISIVLPENVRQITFRQLLSPVFSTAVEETDDPGLCVEPWYDPQMLLPREWDAVEVETCLEMFSRWCTVSSSYFIQPRIATASEINKVIHATGNKASVLANGLIELLRFSLQFSKNVCDETLQGESILFLCDKQGGRHFYAPLLQEAFPDGWIVADREGPAESRYRVMNLGRDITVSFRPKADGDSVSVALASMLAKYLREICMMQFNAFWAKHVPGLKPTAGYPLDAKRYYAEIEPAMESLGIAKDAVWRVK
ncbi:hypothetical protein BH11PLA2_BH11PLA2_48170 [soil metagenome]